MIVKSLRTKYYAIRCLSILGATIVFSIFDVQAEDVKIPTHEIKTLHETKRYFLISIGVNNYVDDFWPSLKWPEKDAAQVADNLGKDTDATIVNKLLIGDSANLDEVSASLGEISQKAKAEDTVVLYISSHGTLAQNISGDLERIVVLKNSKHDQLFSTGLSHKMLQKWLDGLKSRKKMMIFATCHSGEGKSRLPPKVAKFVAGKKGKSIALSDVSEGALVLAAAAKGEAARENDELQGDIYTHFLLEALTVYDRNRDGMVSALEAHDYARDRTWAFTKGRQRPTANVKFVGDADIPLYGTRNNRGLAVLEAYDERLAGFFLQIDNGEKGRLPYAFPLLHPKSNVSLYAPGGDKPVSSYKVQLSPGQTVSLEQVMYDRPFSVGLSVKRANWSDTVWEKLSGDNNSTHLEVNASYHWSHGLGVGFLVGLSRKEKSSLIDIIDTSAQVRSFLLLAEYRHVFDPLWFAGRFEIGQESAKIGFSDRSVDDNIAFSDKSMAYGASIMLAYILPLDFSIVMEASYRKVDWDLGIVGDLQGDRYQIGLGIDYRFGPIARTKW